MNDGKPYRVVCPLELADDRLERYLEIRMLRLLFDSSGARSVRWDQDTGEAYPGVLYPKPIIYDFPPKDLPEPASLPQGLEGEINK